MFFLIVIVEALSERFSIIKSFLVYIIFATLSKIIEKWFFWQFSAAQLFEVFYNLKKILVKIAQTFMRMKINQEYSFIVPDKTR